jgi:lipoprotein-releasing system ATP-binding protein
MSNGHPILSLRAVSKRYAPAAGAEPVQVLRDVSLVAHPGDAIAIIGPSGSGKSTLLNIMGTLDLPDSGAVEFEGQDITRLDASALAAVRNKRIGFIFQSHHLLPQCSTLENVLVPTLAATGRSSPADAKRASQLLDRVGLAHRLTHLPGQLSGGERQRVAVVRALINGPALLLADEPTGALDRDSALALGELLAELNRELGLTLLVVTHSQHLAARLGRVLELRQGALTPADLPPAA